MNLKRQGRRSAWKGVTMQSTGNTRNSLKLDAVMEIHAAFEAVLKNDKCRSCACLYRDVLGDVSEKIRAFGESENDNRLVPVQKDFERWIKEADVLNMHG